MNSIFSTNRDFRGPRRLALTILAFFGAFVTISATPFVGRIFAHAGSDPAAEFGRIAAQLSAARLSGEEEDAAQMERALAYLDSVALSVLNVPAEPNLEGANRGLAGLVSHTPPVGENYRLVKLGGSPAVYAMVINFGLGGPAAVRIYAGAPGHYAMAARIDHTVQKDFFDSDLEMVPVSTPDAVFVTVAGRTDDLSTGLFSAWQFDGHRLIGLWTSDLLQQSTYTADDAGFHLAYCSSVDEDRPSQCLKMSQDLYRFQAGAWKRVQTSDIPAPNPPGK
jgi:hypothetical protein